MESDSNWRWRIDSMGREVQAPPCQGKLPTGARICVYPEGSEMATTCQGGSVGAALRA